MALHLKIRGLNLWPNHWWQFHRRNVPYREAGTRTGWVRGSGPHCSAQQGVTGQGHQLNNQCFLKIDVDIYISRNDTNVNWIFNGLKDKRFWGLNNENVPKSHTSKIFELSLIFQNWRSFHLKSPLLIYYTIIKNFSRIDVV